MSAPVPVAEVMKGSFLPTGEVRLNLGGRDKKIDGFLTMDMEPGSDIVGDISDLCKFKDGIVDEIYASHCLEHFPHTRTLEVLREWRRVLKKGGKLWVGVPDFDATVRVYLETGMTDWIRNFLYGDQGYDKAFHYTCFTWPTLRGLLHEAGFEDATRIKQFKFNLGDCSTLTVNGMSVSLNVEATA